MSKSSILPSVRSLGLPRWTVFLGSVLWAAGSLAPAEAGSVVLDRIVAVVNDEVILLSELEEERIRIEKESKPQPGAAPSVLPSPRQQLVRLIEKRLELQAARREGIAVSDADVDRALEEIKAQNRMTEADFNQALAEEGLSLPQYRRRLQDQIMGGRLYEKVLKGKTVVSDAEIAKEYEEHGDRYSRPVEVRVRHMFFASSPAALQDAGTALARVGRGEAFADVARAVSQAPSARDGGDLGFLVRGTLADQLDQAVFSLAPGETSAPIPMSDGVHLLQAAERRGGDRIPLDQVRETIAADLKKRKNQEAVDRWVQDLKIGAFIDIRL
ncbi:MAG: peptidyl-prolyl cis-trans isomerase [Nitrospirae bacterium]|nr:peptidyl-prolyl cis-trans isomerase [Nitrospirota bacterium]